MKLAGAYIHDETYERLAALAAANNRTLAGQCRHLFDRALRGELEVPACAPVMGAAAVKAETHAGHVPYATSGGSASATTAMPAAAVLAGPVSARGASADLPAAQGGKCGAVCSGRCAQGERAARAASPAV